MARRVIPHRYDPDEYDVSTVERLVFVQHMPCGAFELKVSQGKAIAWAENHVCRED